MASVEHYYNCKPTSKIAVSNAFTDKVIGIIFLLFVCKSKKIVISILSLMLTAICFD